MDFSNPTRGATKTVVLEKIDGRITDGGLMSSSPPFDHLDWDRKSPKGVGGGGVENTPDRTELRSTALLVGAKQLQLL